jgi:hypothetical protein
MERRQPVRMSAERASGPRVVASARYANAFVTTPGRCFRLLENARVFGQLEYCSSPVIARGRWKDRNGNAWVIEACAHHVRDLEVDGVQSLGPEAPSR